VAQHETPLLIGQLSDDGIAGNLQGGLDGHRHRVVPVGPGEHRRRVEPERQHGLSAHRGVLCEPVRRLGRAVENRRWISAITSARSIGTTVPEGSGNIER